MSESRTVCGEGMENVGKKNSFFSMFQLFPFSPTQDEDEDNGQAIPVRALT